MAKLVSITETAEAITAEAIAYVWEEYDAPRKRVPRARIVEHRFNVSISKYTEEAAPLAFVVEHFPEASANFKIGAYEYRPGYDQPVRYAGGKFYTPARLAVLERTGEQPSRYESGDPRERLAARLGILNGVNDYTRAKYAEAIARDDVRADKWPVTNGATAADVDEDAARIIDRLVIIGNTLYTECQEPAYIYDRPCWGSSRPGDILACTHYYGTPYGAMDRAAIAYNHPDATRRAFIRVLRSDLVSIDNTADEYRYQDALNQDALRQARAALDRARENLAEAQAAADKTRAALDTYTADPRAYWIDKINRLESYGNQHYNHRAAAIRRAINAR